MSHSRHIDIYLTVPSKGYKFDKWQMNVSLTPFIGRISDLSSLYIKGCYSVNKQFGVDSFHDWVRHHGVFATHPHTKRSHYRPLHHIRLNKPTAFLT